jgi:hypothetical protein
VEWNLISTARKREVDIELWTKNGGKEKIGDTACMVLLKRGEGGLAIQCGKSGSGGGVVQVMIITPGGKRLWRSEGAEAEGMSVSMLLYLGDRLPNSGIDSTI